MHRPAQRRQNGRTGLGSNPAPRTARGGPRAGISRLSDAPAASLTGSGKHLSAPCRHSPPPPLSRYKSAQRRRPLSPHRPSVAARLGWTNLAFLLSPLAFEGAKAAHRSPALLSRSTRGDCGPRAPTSGALPKRNRHRGVPIWTPRGKERSATAHRHGLQGAKVVSSTAPTSLPRMAGGGGAAAPGGEATTPRRPLHSEAPKPEEGAAAANRELEVRGASASSSLPAAVRSALELAEARRKLLEAEGRRRLVSELESRVQQLHRVFLEAELRLTTRAESLGRLGSGVAQAEIHLAAHGQRLKKNLRRYKKARAPAMLASALGSCVPWAAGRMRRGRGGAPEPPESPFKRSLQGAAASPQPPRRARP